TPQLLPGTDPDCVKVVERQITKAGGKILKNTRADGYESRPDGSVAVKVSTDGKEQAVECDQVLVAVGMKPRSRGIGLEELGVQFDARGFVQTNDQGQTNVNGLYAIGDVSGPPMLAHKASKVGEVVADVIAGKRAAKDWNT